MYKIKILLIITIILFAFNGCTSKSGVQHISDVEEITQKKIVGVDSEIITMEFRQEECNGMKIDDVIRENKKSVGEWLGSSTYVFESYSYGNCIESIENPYFDIEDDTIIFGYDVVEGCDEVADCNCTYKIVYKLSNLPKKEYIHRWNTRRLCR